MLRLKKIILCLALMLLFGCSSADNTPVGLSPAAASIDKYPVTFRTNSDGDAFDELYIAVWDVGIPAYQVSQIGGDTFTTTRQITQQHDLTWDADGRYGVWAVDGATQDLQFYESGSAGWVSSAWALTTSNATQNYDGFDVLALHRGGLGTAGSASDLALGMAIDGAGIFSFDCLNGVITTTIPAVQNPNVYFSIAKDKQTTLHWAGFYMDTTATQTEAAFKWAQPRIKFSGFTPAITSSYNIKTVVDAFDNYWFYFHELTDPIYYYCVGEAIELEYQMGDTMNFAQRSFMVTPYITGDVGTFGLNMMDIVVSNGIDNWHMDDTQHMIVSCRSLVMPAGTTATWELIYLRYTKTLGWSGVSIYQWQYDTTVLEENNSDFYQNLTTFPQISLDPNGNLIIYFVEVIPVSPPPAARSYGDLRGFSLLNANYYDWANVASWGSVVTNIDGFADDGASGVLYCLSPDNQPI